jgi:hypothetical protein
MLLIRLAISPELRGLSVKQFRTFESSGTLAFKPAFHLSSRLSPLHFLSDAKESARPKAGTDRSAIAIPASSTIFTGVALSPPKGGVRWEGTRPTPSRLTPAIRTRVQQNDLVAFASHAGTWKVVAPVNGSKADIRRSGGFDTRIVTASLENITVVQRAGSPGYIY